LLHYAKQIEMTLGREQSFRNAPRVIDIDILLYDQLHFEEKNLSIPHPRMTERAFVLVPLSEIAPNIIHPVYKTTIRALLAKISTQGVQKTHNEISLPHSG